MKSKFLQILSSFTFTIAAAHILYPCCLFFHQPKVSDELKTKIRSMAKN